MPKIRNFMSQLFFGWGVARDFKTKMGRIGNITSIIEKIKFKQNGRICIHACRQLHHYNTIETNRNV